MIKGIVYKKQVRAYGQQTIIGCDGKCNKAWVINNRPRVSLDDSDIDNCYFLPDDELLDAPIDPGTYEGGCGKPYDAESSDDMNKWCFRECERCESCAVGEELKLPGWSKKIYNMPLSDEGKADMINDKRNGSLEKLDV